MKHNTDIQVYDPSTSVVYTHGHVTVPIADPLVVHINGNDYFMGEREAGPYIMIWPYQPPEKTKGGIILSNEMVDSAPYNNRYGLVLEVGEIAWANSLLFPKPRCKVGDWVMYRRYETQIWGHSVLAKKCPDTGLIYESDKLGPEIVIGKILGEYVIHNLGPNLNPNMVNTNKHIGR